jgi:hypothetical protein
MTDRLCGYVLDNDRPLRPFFAGVPSRSSLPDRWRVWTPDAMDQGSTQSCTGFAAKLMIDGTAHSTGKGFRASARGMYTVGRYALYGAGEALVDKGAHFRSLFDEAMKFGVMHEADCPWDPARINEDPGFDAVIAGQGQKLTLSGWYTLDESGDDRMNAIRSANCQGFPVGGAWRIHKGFQKETAFTQQVGGIPMYSHALDTGAYVGNHAMVISGYDVVDGEEYFLLQNSWGKGFGYNGLFWAHRDWIDTAWDLTVVRVVPLAKSGDDRQQDHHADDHVRVGTHEQKRLPRHAPRKPQHSPIVPEESHEEHPARYHAAARLLHPPAPQQAHPAAARPGVRRRLRAAHRAEGGVPVPRRHHHRRVLQALQRGRAPAPRHHQGVMRRGGADLRGCQGVRGDPVNLPRIHSSTEAVLTKILNGSEKSLSVLGCMHLAFLFGKKVGAYLAFRRVNIMASSLTHEEIYCLGGTTEEILDKIEKFSGTRGVDIEAILKEKLEVSMASQMIGIGMIDKAKEALEEAYLGHRVSCRETDILKDLIKELTKDKEP